MTPTTSQKDSVTWHHERSCHPGINCMEQTIRQHFTWNKLTDNVRKSLHECHACQVTKTHTRKCSHPPPKQDDTESKPWECLCADLVGLCQMHTSKNKVLVLHCVTMVDLATGWFNTAKLPNKRANNVANVIELQ